MHYRIMRERSTRYGAQTILLFFSFRPFQNDKYHLPQNVLIQNIARVFITIIISIIIIFLSLLFILNVF